jgi:hypothetical protein
MITVNVIEDRIVGSIGEEPFSVSFTKEVYDKMLAAAQVANAAETMEEYSKACEEFKVLTVEDYTTLIESKNPNIFINKKTGEFFLKHNDVVSSIPMPKALVDRIYDSMDKGLDFTPLIKLWTRWLRNPVLRKKTAAGRGKDFSERMFNFINMTYVHPQMQNKYIEEGFSHQVATEKATMYQVKITNEGLINGYKVSKEILHKFDPETGEMVDRYKRTFNVDTGEIESDGIPSIVEDRLFEPAIMGSGGDDFYCEGPNGYTKPGHFIKVGCVHRLENWDQVNTNDNTSCVPGLHVGGLKYIAGYSGEIHNVFIDPMHIGAIPDDTTGAIRCLQYFVHSSLAGVNGSIYHSSKYAAMTDAEWSAMQAEAVKLKGEAAQKATDEANELNSL